jgi:Cu/Ag efflux protein CusF
MSFKLNGLTLNSLSVRGLLAAFWLLCAPGAFAAESHNGRVVKIDTAENKVTIAAVMGHKSLRVLKPELLSSLKVGDQIKFTIGQDGTEVVVVAIEINKQ